MERGFRGVRRALYHPPGQSAAAEAPGEQRSPQEQSSWRCGGKPGAGVSQDPTALAQELPRASCLHPAWPVLQGLLPQVPAHTRARSPAAPLQVPG